MVFFDNITNITNDIDALKYKTKFQTGTSTQTLFSDYTVCDHLQCNDLAVADWTGRYLYSNSVYAYNLDIGKISVGTTTINSDVCSIQSRITTIKELSCDKIFTPFAQLTNITGYSGVDYISIGDATHRVDVLQDLTIAGNITNTAYNN
jgi:hypothetical protein